MNTERLKRVIVLGGVIAALGFTVKHTRHYVFPKRFAVVEPGELYRGGWQEPWPLNRIIAAHGIKTILNLACDPDEEEAAGEGDVVRNHGLKWVKILMPGTGRGSFEQMDQAADVLNDPENHPIFFHCAAGVHRTNMALSAFRLKHCGWTLDEVVSELEQHKFSPERRPNQYEHLQRYIKHLEAN